MPQSARNAPANSALVLSPEDVNRLLSDTSSVTRIDMTHKIASAFNTSHLNPREVQVAEQIFRLLMRDTEVRVRVSLSQYVKDSTHISRDIVMSLARDVEEVSLPVLECSEVLSDADLSELIQATEQVSRYLAISKRRRVSPVVADKLLAKGDPAVAEALVSNEGADLSEETFEEILNTCRSSESVMRALSNRPGLPLATVDKMVTVVSSTLADKIKQKYKLPTEQIDREVEKTRETETLNLISLASGEADVDKLVNQMHATGRLNASIILNALCQGDFIFFETGLAKLAGLPVANARKLISDRGDLGFRAIYNKSGLPEAMFPAVKLLLAVVRELDERGEKKGGNKYVNRVVERLLQRAEEHPVDNLSYIIALVRKGAQ